MIGVYSCQFHNNPHIILAQAGIKCLSTLEKLLRLSARFYTANPNKYNMKNFTIALFNLTSSWASALLC